MVLQKNLEKLDTAGLQLLLYFYPLGSWPNRYLLRNSCLQCVCVCFSGIQVDNFWFNQVFAEFEFYGGALGLASCCVYGGSPYAAQEYKLKRGVDIIIGTPGRIKV